MSEKKLNLYILMFFFVSFSLFTSCNSEKETKKEEIIKKEENKENINSKIDTTQKKEEVNENNNSTENTQDNSQKNNSTKKETSKEDKKETPKEIKKETPKEEESTKIEPPKKKYDKVFPYYNNRAVAQSGSKYCLLNPKGEEVTPLKYDFLEGFDIGGDMIRARIHDKVGYLDKNGNEIIPLSFRYVERFNKGLAQARLIDGETFYINKQGQKVCDVLDKYHEGIARIKVGKNIGYINEQGVIIIQPQYIYGTNFNKGTADVKKAGDDNIFTINKQGVCVKDCK